VAVAEPPAPPGLRAVRDADSAALIRLITDCWSEYPGCVMDVDGEEPWLRAPASAYARKRGRMWVVEDGTASDGTGVVACAGYVPCADLKSADLKSADLKNADLKNAELKNMYVAAPARRRGLGTYLVGLVLAAARADGSARVQLWSDTRFLDAHRLYTR
jgi:GNAT superfamily N-acetyltransferase